MSRVCCDSRSVIEAASRSVVQSVSQLANQSVRQIASQPVGRSVSDSTSQLASQSVSSPSSRSNNQSASSQSANRSVRVISSFANMLIFWCALRLVYTISVVILLYCGVFINLLTELFSCVMCVCGTTVWCACMSVTSDVFDVFLLWFLYCYTVHFY